MHKLKRLLLHDWPVHFLLLITNWLPDNVFVLRLRGALVSPFLGSCKGNLRLGRNITFYNPSQIYLGKDVYIAYGSWFMAGERITVGDEVLFGPYCVVVSSNHTKEDGSFRYGTPKQRPILIGDGCWLAAHVVVAAGTTIGHGTLVAANAAVTESLPAHVLAAGQPAKVVKVYE